MYVFIFLIKLRKLSGRLLGIAAHTAYDMLFLYMYPSVPLGLWSGNFFLIAPFPDHCLLVPFYKYLPLWGGKQEKSNFHFSYSF